MLALPFAHGGPPLQGQLRDTAEDFIVIEELGYEASGDGEHALLTVRKRHTNTDWLAQELARFAGVRRPAVSYAGLKDRHALTTQAFSIHLPGQADPNWSDFPHAEVEILTAQRHHRKLRRGALQGNRFELTLRHCRGDKQEAERRLQSLASLGAPNYFGEQRFGRDFGNLDRARAMFAGEKVKKRLQGILLSSARSQVFNAVLAARVDMKNWNQPLPGEVWGLDGSRSWFQQEDIDDALRQRCEQADIHPTGPLWGSGDPPSHADVLALEQDIIKSHSDLASGLVAAGLPQDRRALRLMPQKLQWRWLDDESLWLSFSLVAGAYATVILRELLTEESNEVSESREGPAQRR